jgi:hypothetical protein
MVLKGFGFIFFTNMLNKQRKGKKQNDVNLEFNRLMLYLTYRLTCNIWYRVNTF